jgi:hypothetical protein
MTTVIGFHGPMRSGKDTACAHAIDILSARGKTVARRGFADKLKMSAALALGLEPASPEDAIEWCNQMKENGIIDVVVGYPDSVGDPDLPENHEYALKWQLTGRQYLQFYGTEAHRDVFGPDFWVDALLPQTQDDDPDIDALDYLVISDVRFASEADRILSYPSGVVVQIVRDGTGGGGHVSETPLPEDKVTHILRNDGDTAASLRPRVEELLDHIGFYGGV